MLSSQGGEETNLELLLKAVGGDKYAKKRKLPDSSENDAESVTSDVLLDDPEDEEQGDSTLKQTNNLMDRDHFGSFNEEYEKFIASNSADEDETHFNHPLFSAYTVNSPTPLVKYLSKLEDVPCPTENPAQYFIADTLAKRIRALRKENESAIPMLSRRHKYTFACLNTYSDVFYVNNHVPSLDGARFAYSLHIANHLAKSAAQRKESKEEERTQGFTRPKVLVVCGLRCIAREFVNNLLALIPCAKGVGTENTAGQKPREVRRGLFAGRRGPQGPNRQLREDQETHGLRQNFHGQPGRRLQARNQTGGGSVAPVRALLLERPRRGVATGPEAAYRIQGERPTHSRNPTTTLCHRSKCSWSTGSK